MMFNTIRRPRPFSFQCRVGKSLSVAVLVLQAMLYGTLATAQSPDAESWKAQTLSGLAEKIENASRHDAAELKAQRKWLSGWQPGRMKAEPKAIGPGVAKKRNEPKLNSCASDWMRQVIARAVGDCLDRQVYVDLNCIACQNPNDAAAIQALLFWLDDDPARRKEFLPEIENVTARLICILNLPVQCCPDVDRKLALEFAMYRRARALAYRELPSVVVKRPIENPQQLNHQIQMAYQQLVGIAGSGRTEFILLEIRMLRRAGHHGRALMRLEEYGATVLPKWYQKKRRDILQALDWPVPYREAAKIFSENFPQEAAVSTSATGQGN